MRGMGIRSEPLGSHFICPSCVYRIANEAGARSPRRPFLKKFSRNHYPVSTPLTPRTTSRWASTTASATLQDAFAWLEHTQPIRSKAIPYTVLDPAQPGKSTRIQSERDHIADVLREGQPDRVMRAFLAPESISDDLYTLPAPAFVEALRLLSPAYFLEPYKKLHRYFPHFISRAKGIESLEDYFDRFALNMEEIVRRRRRAGYKLGLAEYTHFLDCARSMGLVSMATWVWRSMATEGIEPNTECFNYYMETILWDTTHIAKEKYHIRNTPRVLRKRSFFDRNINWRGYKTGKDGARDQVLALFDTMVSEGVQPNEVTFTHVMVASSRDAHVGSIKNILKTVWNIDVDLLVSGETGDIPPVRELAKSSPLHPTSNLLFAVAHVFGQNHDFPTALQLVDVISSQYGIEVPERVWYELFEWTFVLSRKRYGKDRAVDSVGQIQHNALEHVFKSISTAHGVTTSTPLLNMFVRIASVSVSPRAMDHYMKQGRAAFYETENKVLRLQDVIEQYNELRRKHSIREKLQQQADGMKSEHANLAHIRGYDDALHTRDLLRIDALRTATYIQRWVKLLLARAATAGRPSDNFPYQVIPNFIKEWKPFLPTLVHYNTPTGSIDFDPQTFWPNGRRLRPENLVYKLGQRLDGEEKALSSDSLPDEIGMMADRQPFDLGEFHAGVDWNRRNC